MTKDAIRSEMLAQRKLLTPQIKEMLGNTITFNLLNLPEFNSSKVVYLYSAYNNEVDTIEITEYCLANKIKVLMPCSYMSMGVPKMEFYNITSRTDLVPGYKGILEPDRRKAHVVKLPDYPDCIIVPGVAFDTYKNRIGYGAGFYDAYLRERGFADSITKPYIIGLAYEFQMGYDITPDEGDVKMTMIVTENGVYR